MGMTLQERETLLRDLDICTRLGGCAGCSRLGREGIACAQDLMSAVREAIRSAPAWIPAESEPKVGDPFLMEPDLQIRESEPVLCLLDDGSQRVGRIMTETDPNDPEYRWHGWIREADGDPIEEVVSWMPLPEAKAKQRAEEPGEGDKRT